MSKMTRAWIDAQIEHEMERGNHPEAVRDLAALIEVRKYMLEREESEMHHDPYSLAHMKERAYDHGEKPISHDPILDTIPTMDQIEKAMGAVSVNNAADKKRMLDAMTWAKIIKGEE